MTLTKIYNLTIILNYGQIEVIRNKFILHLLESSKSKGLRWHLPGAPAQHLSRYPAPRLSLSLLLSSPWRTSSIILTVVGVGRGDNPPGRRPPQPEVRDPAVPLGEPAHTTISTPDLNVPGDLTINPRRLWCFHTV